MYFNKKRFKKFLKTRIDQSLTNLSLILTLQKYMRDGFTSLLLDNAILIATDDEIEAFKDINNNDQDTLDKELKASIRYIDTGAYDNKFLDQINAVALSNDKKVQNKAIAALYGRGKLTQDLHAEYNRILIEYHLGKLSSYQATQQLKALESKVKDEFGQDKEKHAKHQQRFTEMLLAGREYIATNPPRSSTRLPLFKTSIGEKRRSKLALATFSILSVLTLTAAIGASLVFGGYVVLPAFLAWAGPILFSLLIGFSVASGISILALLSESFKPQAIKHFFKTSARAIGYVFIGLIKFLNYWGTRCSEIFNTHLFLSNHNVDIGNSYWSAYFLTLKEHPAKTLIKTLTFPFTWLLGAGIGLFLSPILAAYENRRFAKNQRTSKAVKIIVFVASLLTWPISFFIACGFFGERKTRKASKLTRERLFDETNTKTIAAWEVDQLKEHKNAIEIISKKNTVKAGTRYEQLVNILNNNASNKEKISAINTVLLAEGPAVKGIKDNKPNYKKTRFIENIFYAFQLGIFEKPNNKDWKSSAHDYQGQEYLPTPPSL
jgi:hypothetical protein